jgi:FlaA1/EpsC-like NDP-sugar epimerase
MKKSAIEGKVVLITGGTGSFGHHAARALRGSNPRELRIFSRDEKKQWEMQRQFPSFTYILGDVRDRARVEQAMRGVDLVFHAAALKQVPSCEQYPWEAFKTNALGSQNVCEAALDQKVGVVVALSTDKAVKPVNAMGISKAMMEKLVCAYNRFACDTVFCCVRYGNVMGSRGSVIPLFLELIAQNKPLPITDPTMTRFLMTLEQSFDLLLHAMVHAKGGEVFVRKAPACTVLDLAKAMAIKFSPSGDAHPIEFIGVRPGEKIHEVLVNEYEARRSAESASHFTIYPEYSTHYGPNVNLKCAEYSSDVTRRVTSQTEFGQLLDSMRSLEAYA